MDGRPILVRASLNGREDLLAEHHERVACIVGDSDALTRHHADEALPSRDAPPGKDTNIVAGFESSALSSKTSKQA